MAVISFHVVDGVDKGRQFVDVETPLTIGREEGNALRLNDERVSRFHAKIQEDQGQVVLTDLDSTNGTRVNGETVQLRLLRPGDRVNLGRSTLVFGRMEEIASMVREQEKQLNKTPVDGLGATNSEPAGKKSNADNTVDNPERVDALEIPPPELPTRLTPAQAAQLSEVLDFLHRTMADALDGAQLPARSREARIPVTDWHRLQGVLTHLANYAREIAEPHGHGAS